MDHSCFDRFIRTLGTATGRRTLLQGTAAFGAAVLGGVVLHDVAEAKILCRKDGTRCKKKNKKCQAKFCLRTPFTIEARWSNGNSDHDAFLFVPSKEGSNNPSPWIAVDCRPSTSNCENEVYPFACVSQDAQGPGDEITTVRRLLDGTYEYWIDLDFPAPTGDVEVLLRNATGRVMRTWSSPQNAASNRTGWHVFDLAIAGAARSITSVDGVTAGALPFSAHSPSTNVCPF